MSNPDLGTGGNSVWHDPYIQHLKENFFPDMNAGHLPDDVSEYLDYWSTWIESSELNQFRNLDSFNKRYVSLGTTQALDWWHYWCMANGYNLRMYRGEYPYNRDVLLEGQWMQDRYIDGKKLKRGDAIVISVPFSGSGMKPEHWKTLMINCTAMDIPVFVDCAWFGTCHGIEVKLNHECIKMVAFSTTKGLSCGNWRSGIVFTNFTEEECGLGLQTEWRHGIHLNTSIGLSLMKNFSPDTMPNRYMKLHKQVCEHYGFQETNTIHIALAPLTEKWNRFSRDGTFNRVNIRDALKRLRKTGEFYDGST